MASPFALPSSALPHAHQQHLHSIPRSPSSLHAWRASMSRESLPVHHEDEARATDRAHTHSHSLSPNRMATAHASNSSAALLRDKPPPASLDTLDGWTQERTAGGKFVLTPAPGTHSTPYTPPRQHHHQHHHHRHDGHPLRQSHSHDDAHTHPIGDDKATPSAFTLALLPFAAKFPILRAILLEKDSRRIFYFMTINFCFMAVQAFYGYHTDSLGLLSDSIHMFFDCVALLVGLLAAVMSKWPPSQKFPYGFGKIETLSGFANGILLMLLSVEIAVEAFERLWEGTRTKRLGELFIVSSLGLAVNLIGMMAFGHHHHHGHDHGHSHSHDHGHTHSHSHAHSHAHSHSHGPEEKGDDCASPSSRSHFHDNENMHGIYLHVLADTLGSVSVIVSTILTSVWGWSGWDPLASCFIAVLIFFSSKPLVLSSAKRLLLSVPEDAEYNLRNTLGGILQQRGVVSYTAPKLWPDDRTGSDKGSRLVGVVHITVARDVSMDEARERVQEYLLKEGIDVVVQVEREGDYSCWCAKTRLPATPRGPKTL
ncbi:hypothetical protein HIM_01407 [Hirsutella minnesotensis 3608]|nr:hypothetical protein HIM_01407 [Hirsutella minnesotensis 3608]